MPTMSQKPITKNAAKTGIIFFLEFEAIYHI